MPYISIECNLKDMNINLVNAVNTCESRACSETYHSRNAKYNNVARLNEDINFAIQQ